MKILIIGGRGFVGSYVVKELEDAGHNIIVLSNLSHPSENTRGWHYEYGDVRYEYDIERVIDGVDCIVHLAAKINVDRSRDNPRPFVDTNIIGTFNVLEVCRKHNIKLVYASTSETLGTMRSEYEQFGMNESHPYGADNPYGATKAAADMLVLGWIKSYGIRATILRSFNITGIGQSRDKEGGFIPKTIETILQDKNPVIFGSGKQTRDYVWCGDAAKAYRMLVEGDYAGELYHIGTGVESSIESVAQKLISISGKQLTVQYVQARYNEVKRLKCDYSKIRLIGWKPTKYLDGMLREMYEARRDKGMDR